MANEIKQKITLDNKDYVKAVEDANQALRTNTTQANNALTENSKVFSQNEKQVKTWSNTM